jgi:hypothetical protein
MEKTIDDKIDYLNKFFNYFHINDENFSKSLQNDIQIITPILKYNEELLTTSEKEKMIFFSESLNEEKEKKEEISNINILDNLIKVLKHINLELKIQNDKLNISYEAQKINFEKEQENTSFKNTINNFEKLNIKIPFSNIPQTNDILSTLNNIHQIKEEIKIEKQKRDEINKELQEEKVKLKNFYNLPCDINQIRNLVEIKREEYNNMKK